MFQSATVSTIKTQHERWKLLKFTTEGTAWYCRRLLLSQPFRPSSKTFFIYGAPLYCWRRKALNFRFWMYRFLKRLLCVLNISRWWWPLIVCDTITMWLCLRSFLLSDLCLTRQADDSREICYVSEFFFASLARLRRRTWVKHFKFINFHSRK